MRKRLAVDQDQVLADLLTEWVSRYNYDYNDNLKPNEITEWNWSHIVKPECGDKIYSYLDDPDLFLNLPVIKDSQSVLEQISNKYEIFVVTAPWNYENIKPKWLWLKKHFDFIPEKNYVFTRTKSIVNADWLIDDKPANFSGFQGEALLFDAPHNQNETEYTRVLNWKEIELFFLEKLPRRVKYADLS